MADQGQVGAGSTWLGIVSVFRETLQLTEDLQVRQCVDDIDDDDILSFKIAAGDERVLTTLFYDYDYDAVDGVFEKTTQFDFTSKGVIGPRELRIQSQGIRTSLGGLAIVNASAEIIRDRYANPPMILELEVFFRKHRWEVGDFVCVRSEKIPNWETGSLGMDNEIFQVVNAQVMFVPTPSVRVTLLKVVSLTLPAAAGTVQVNPAFAEQLAASEALRRETRRTIAETVQPTESLGKTVLAGESEGAGLSENLETLGP